MTDKYNMNIPGDIADFIQNYINTNPELGFKFVSQYVIHLLREDIKTLSKDKIIIPEGEYTAEDIKKMIIGKEIGKKDEKKIRLTSGEYTKEALEKILREN